MATINELDAAIRQNDNEIMFYLAEGASEESLVIKHRRVVQSVLKDARRRAEGCERCMNMECAVSGTGHHCTTTCDKCQHNLKDKSFCPYCGRALRGEKEERE